MTPDFDDLIQRARAVADNAFAPASRFRVGAALLGADGSVHVGCNVENASYGLTICAERAAVCAAVAHGVREIVAAAIWTDLDQPASPCGACRQVLAEFGASMQVVLAGRGEPVHTSLDVLLPNPFTFDSLPGNP